MTKNNSEETQSFTINVNGQQKEFSKECITYPELVKLAFNEDPSGGNTLVTITYESGPSQNPEGSLVKGDKVYVQDGMEFYVTATDKS